MSAWRAVSSAMSASVSPATYQEPTAADQGRFGEGVRAEAERGHAAEVAPAAAQPPQQLRQLVAGCRHPTAVGEHEVGAEEAVAGEPVSPAQVAEPATERGPGDARAR